MLHACVPHDFVHDTLEAGLYESALCGLNKVIHRDAPFACAVETDRDFGRVEIVSCALGDDFGKIANKAIVVGHARKGIIEEGSELLMKLAASYISTGQLPRGSHMDYCKARADDVSKFRASAKKDGPCTHNRPGVKSADVSSTIGAAASDFNAVVNTRVALKIDDLAIPATTKRFRSAISGAEASA